MRKLLMVLMMITCVVTSGIFAVDVPRQVVRSEGELTLIKDAINAKFDYYDSCVNNDMLYSISERGLCIFDLTDPLSPQLLTTVPGITGGTLEVYNGYAYVQTYSYEVESFVISVYDLNDFLNPQLVFEANIGSDRAYFEWYQDYLFFYTTDDIGIYALHNPGKPVLLKSYKMERGINNICFYNETGFISHEQLGLLVIDASDLNNIALITSFNDSVHSFDDLYATGTYLYATSLDDQANDTTLQVFDIRNLQDIQFVSSIAIGSKSNYVSSINGSICTLDELALRVFDTSDPAIPVQTAQIDFEGSSSENSFNIHNNYIYQSCYSDGIKIIDFTAPLQPVVTGKIHALDYSRDLALKDGYAFVLNERKGINIIDVRHPANATLVKVIDMPGTTERMMISGNYLYAQNNEIGLVIIDISIPLRSEIVGEYTCESRVYSFFIDGNYAYIGTYADDVRVLDISNKNSISEITTMKLDRIATSLYAHENMLYIGQRVDKTGGKLQQVDISNIYNPVVINTVSVAGSVNDMIIKDGYLYATSIYFVYKYGFYGFLYTVDTTSFHITNTIADQSFCGNLSIEGNTLYFFSTQNATPGLDSLKVVDITVKDTPLITMSYNIEFIYGFTYDEHYFYFGCGKVGMKIYTR